MKEKFIAYLKDESGQTSTEYILLIAVVAAVIFKFKAVIEEKLTGEGGLINGVFDKASGLLNSN